MYKNSDNARIEEKILKNAQLVKNLYKDKNKLDKKFTTLLGDVKRWLDAIENHVLEQSVAKLKKSHEKQALVEFGNMEKKNKKWEEERKRVEGGKEKARVNVVRP
jgi:hypothetical protein